MTDTTLTRPTTKVSLSLQSPLLDTIRRDQGTEHLIDAIVSLLIECLPELIALYCRRVLDISATQAAPIDVGSRKLPGLAP